MDEPEIPDPFCNPDNPVAITFDEITSAAYRIKSGIRNTECSYSEHLSNLTGMEIYVKKEFMQATGSFKERGARYAMMMLSPEVKARGIAVSSAGNHAQACCYHGNLLGVPVTVFMPDTAPIMKIQKCRDYKGDVKVQGKSLSDAKKLALAYARDHKMLYINGYDHPKVLAGQGTIGLEVWEQVPNLEAVVVPVGGGGLLAGVCNAIKALDKDIKIIGVEPERAACLTGALKAGYPVEVKVGSSLADGLAVAKIGCNSFESVKRILDKCVVVEEQYIALAVLKLVECEKSVVEGAGATPLAAILQGLLPEYKGKKVCLILSGGNMDTSVLGRVLDRGMAADGRLVKAKVNISDRVGGIEQLVVAIGSIGVHIKDISHERAWVTEDVFSVEVKVVCECTGREQSLRLRSFLADKYGHVIFNGTDYPNDKGKKSQIFAPLQTEEEPSVTASEADKPSIQQQIIDFESQPQATVSKEIPSVASSQTGSKRPSQQDGTQTGQGEALQLTGRAPHLSKQSAGSVGSSQQDKSSQQPERIVQQKSVDSPPRPEGSSHSAEKSGGPQAPAEPIQVFKKDSIKEEPIVSSDKSSPRAGGSLHSAEKSAGSQTAVAPVQVSTKKSLQSDQIVSPEITPQQKPTESSPQPETSVHSSEKPDASLKATGSQQKPDVPSPRPASSIHSAGRAGGSQTAAESGVVRKKSSVQTDPMLTSERVTQQKPGEASPRAGGSSHSAVKSAGSQTEQNSKKISIHADPMPSKPDQLTETAQSAQPSDSQKARQNGMASSRPFNSCHCRKRGAPGDYETKT